MNAAQLGKIEEAAKAAWAMASGSVDAVTGVSLRVNEGGSLFEVVYDKDGHLTCKRYS